MDKIKTHLSGYLEKVWNIDSYIERYKKAEIISAKVNRLLKQRRSKAYVLDFNNVNSNVLNLYIRVPESEYSSFTMECLSDLKEKISMAKVELFKGNTIQVRIQKDEIKIPTIIKRFSKTEGLSLPLGINLETAEELWLNLKHNPHLLIAGSTGKGKSVCLENMILHIDEFFDDARMILIDPKRIELSAFENSKKLYCPIVTEPEQAIRKVSDVCKMMDERYRKMRNLRTKDFRKLHEPEIFLIIDEYADLMMVAKKIQKKKGNEDEEIEETTDLEDGICRIAQLGRAAGFHLIIATQRPSVDVITGLIKNNIPTRIAFGVSSGTDSRTILDEGGAEKLNMPGLGILKSENGIEYFKGVFVSEKERDEYLEIHKQVVQTELYTTQFTRTELKNMGGRKIEIFIKDKSKTEEISLPEVIYLPPASVVSHKNFYGVSEEKIREYLREKEVYRNNDAREDLKLTASQANELGQILDRLEVVKAKGRVRNIVNPELFAL